MAQITDKMLNLARRGDLDGVRAELDADPDLVKAALGGHGRTLLWEAVCFGRAELVDFLLERGAPVDACGRHRSESLVMLTPLGVARWRGRDELAAKLAAHGAQLDVYNAAFLGDLAVVRQFVEADSIVVNRALPQDEVWETMLLHFVASGEQLEVARFLCERGADVVSQGPLLLDIAARRGNRALVELFLDWGARVEDLTVFSVMVGGNAGELMPLFVERGLDVNGDNFGHPALVYCSRGDKGEHPDWIEALVAHGADMHIRNRKGDTALHAAARAGFCAVADVLLNAGADVNARNNAGRTPLREAQSKKRHDMAGLLTFRGGEDG